MFIYSRLTIPEFFTCKNPCMKILLNEESHPSAFHRVEKPITSQNSFIVIRELPDLGEKNIKLSMDSESTHHSQDSPKLTKKGSKEAKRGQDLHSIKGLIESRKIDTLNGLEKLDDTEDFVLKRSPKPKTRNSKLSHFRGVSHNGKKWQVMIMGFAKKIYFGGLATEKEASQLYDKYAILMHGLEVSFNISSIFHRLKQILTIQRENCIVF